MVREIIPVERVKERERDVREAIPVDRVKERKG